MNADKFQIDECDAYVLLTAVRYQLKTVQWNIMDESEWEKLTALKSLQQRLEQFLDDAQ
jgi:hypothetical protein